MKPTSLLAMALAFGAAGCDELDETAYDDAMPEETPEVGEADVEDCFPKYLCSKPDLVVVGTCHPDANNVAFEFEVKNVGTATATGYAESQFRWGLNTPVLFGPLDLKPNATFRVAVHPYLGGTVHGPNPITITYQLDRLGVIAEGTAGERNNAGTLSCE